MRKVAVIGGGISGLAVANLLKNNFKVVVFEKESSPGGLIRCKRVNGSLFHICGGHVFNTKNDAVKNWFWSKFDRDNDFIKANRKSAICMEDGRFIDYPIENHVWQLDEEIQRSVYLEFKQMLSLYRDDCSLGDYESFGDFLLKRFGKTLYEIYFRPYNAKVWKRDLSEVPLAWLDGKLPMPKPQDMIAANVGHIEDHDFVHSSFYYPKEGGSQFIADTFSQGLDIRYDSEVTRIECKRVNGEYFDEIIFCGNVKDLPSILGRVELGELATEVNNLQSHGTTAVFCETDAIPYSWFYQPSMRHDSHRFICTGNFSAANNVIGKMTCTVEFTDEIDVEEIKRQLALMPYHPRYVTHNYSRYSYPIQHKNTRDVISQLKRRLVKYGIRLCGRFAEWEYFNMDAAIGSAMNLVQRS